MYGYGKDCLILIPFRLPQISCFILSLKCFSSDSDNCPAVGIGPLLQFPHPLRAGPILLTLLFFPLVPSSYGVLHGSIYILFHWSGTPGHSQLVFCIHFCVWRCIPDVSMERDCTPHPLTPPPCCFPFFFFNKAALNELNTEQFSSKKISDDVCSKNKNNYKNCICKWSYSK